MRVLVWRYVALSCLVGFVVIWITLGVEITTPPAEPKVVKRDFNLKCVEVSVEVEEQEEYKADIGPLKAAVDAVVRRRPDGKGGGRRWDGVYGPVVVMTYSACHGAASQHYGHLSALAVAKLVQPDILVLPHARTRNTYKSRNLLSEQLVNQTTPDTPTEWVEVPLSTVYDVASFAEFMGPDTTVLSTPLKPDNVTLPQHFSGFERHWIPDKPKRFGLNASVVEVRYKRRRPGWMWKELINRGILPYWRRQVVIVDLGCTDIMVSANPAKRFGGMMKEDIALLQRAHETLRLVPSLVKMGKQAVDGMHAVSRKFTGLHLRVERDMFADKSINRWWHMYMRAKDYFLNAKAEHPLFIASGIFEYMPHSELVQTLQPYTDTHDLYHICTAVPLANDVRPWLDYLTLSEATYFQGHDYSSMSWLVVQQRIMKGALLQTASLVRKGTSALQPLCCENDRCLTTVCAAPNGTMTNYAKDTFEVANELPPVVLDIQVE